MDKRADWRMLYIARSGLVSCALILPVEVSAMPVRIAADATGRRGSLVSALIDTEHAAIVFSETRRPATVLGPLAVGKGRPQRTFVLGVPVGRVWGSEHTPQGAEKQPMAFGSIAEMTELAEDQPVALFANRVDALSLDHNKRVTEKIKLRAIVSLHKRAAVDGPTQPLSRGHHGSVGPL